jgi:hypothetical protein
VNTSNVVLKTRIMPEWRKIFEAEDSDLWPRGLGAMEVCSSAEMGALGASHLGTGDHGPKTDRSRPRSVPGRLSQNGASGNYKLLCPSQPLVSWRQIANALNDKR